MSERLTLDTLHAMIGRGEAGILNTTVRGGYAVYSVRIYATGKLQYVRIEAL